MIEPLVNVTSPTVGPKSI